MSNEGYAVDLTELEAAATRLGNLIGFVENSLQQIDGRAHRSRRADHPNPRPVLR